MDSIKYINVNGTTYINGTVYENLYASANGTDESIVSTGEKYIWNNKQDAISDLVTIRSGAAAGATAIQSSAKGVAGGVATLNSDGYVTDTELSTTYIGLTAGNLFGSTQTNDVFTFRPTAGIQDIESGDAPVGGGTIKKVEGNAVAWNQLDNAPKQNTTIGNFTVTWVNDHYHISGQESSGNSYISLAQLMGGDKLSQTIQGHVYYFAGIRNNNNNVLVRPLVGSGANANNPDVQKSSGSYLVTLSDSLYAEFLYHNYSEVDIDYYPQLIDLTLLGIDNLTTVEEVEAWLANNVGLKDYYPHNDGELIPVKDFKVKSVGFNLWDEEWENGFWTISGFVSDNRFIATKDLVPVLPSTSYYIESYNKLSIVFFDAEGKGISTNDTYTNSVFTTPENCRFVAFNTAIVGAVTTYNHDICINLSDDNRNGEYEEHWEREVGIDVTKMYGKLNGAGDSVQVFPDGLKSAGTVHDEIVKVGNVTKAIKRVGKVDAGTLNYYSYGTSLFVSTSSLVLSKNHGYTACGKYLNADISDNKDMTCGIHHNYYDTGIKSLWFIDSSKSSLDATAFKESMSGVIVYYELAEPEEYILDEDILPVQYRVDNYGTEEVLLGNDEGLVSSSPKMTISYGINAADTIADLPHSYVSVLPQQLDEDKQKQARQNINAASQDSIIRIQEQLDAINPKIDNDVYVDMGLPSGLLWAKRNIDVTQPDGFAASPFQYECSFFSFGNVDGHNPISESAFDYDFGASNDGVYASTPGATIQYPSSAGLSFDIARKTLGAPWRLPSTDDFKELIDNCKFVQADGETEIDVSQANKLVTVNNITGIYLKSKINGNLLFFSCSGNGDGTLLDNRGSYGYYWSRNINTQTAGRGLLFYSGGVDSQLNSLRFYGFTGRPVM